MRYIKARKTDIREHKRQLAIAIIAAITGVATLPAPSCLAGKPAHGPIYRTLDTIAGGMEKAIDIAASAGRRVRGFDAQACDDQACDDQACDDGCDAMTIKELDGVYDSPKYPEAPVMDSQGIQGEAVQNYPNAMEPTVMPPLAQPMPAVPLRSPMPSPRSNQNRPNTPPRSQSTPKSAPQRVPQPQPLRQPSPIPKPMLDTPPMLEPKPEKMLEPMAIPQPEEDGWFDNLKPQPGPNRAPNSGELRSPADRTDTLADPFRDDLQGRKKIKSANQPASYWEPW